ncbi:glycosyltransferase family 2 protein [Enterococcus gallinarum]|uniref:glycosyltransferase family 2 protein n=1 Tax=Enterococcus gallinarum TaxID=1353 RepID=UPI00288E5D8A|nr:glycosyltransferase family 2 protein [Enterococcus gallinarum]MDT2707407.1 glycosyltransferase family 2 protein [Enterococcus gallinarum]MDT2716369.1 glycosyltransferase family 2 protein [Enterococcus gallinarum]
MENRVVALVVTYNRKNLLEECLQALLKQDYNLFKIVVIDNNSTDGTEILFTKNNKFDDEIINYYRMEKNLGGAGGFHEGIKIVNENYNYDWLWLMDDDTITAKETLVELVNSTKIIDNENVSFLASSVYGPEDEPMNVPSLDLTKHENGYPDWYRFLDEGIIKIEHATFVSLLISEKAITKIGLPLKSYFIWGDDTEYTLRLTKYYGPAYFVGKSKILHKRFNAKSLSIINEANSDRLKLYNNYYRNNLLNFREYFSNLYFFKKFFSYFSLSIYLLFFDKTGNRFNKFTVIQKGIWEFLLKKYDVNEFKFRIPK